jgi:hypothetical protein
MFFASFFQKRSLFFPSLRRTKNLTPQTNLTIQDLRGFDATHPLLPRRPGYRFFQIIAPACGPADRYPETRKSRIRKDVFNHD